MTVLQDRPTPLQLDTLRITGGRPLQGTVRISGSKNAGLALLAACLLVEGPTTLHDVPEIDDTRTMLELLAGVGAQVRREGTSVTVDTGALHTGVADAAAARRMRASTYLLGPLLARLGEAEVAMPGGCPIGARPVDLHALGLQALGARVDSAPDCLRATANRLRGCRIALKFPSVGATIQVLLAACLAEGETRLINAAREPEVVDLARFLRRLGAHIHGEGTPVITVRGVRRLQAGAEYPVSPDRIEAGTFACAAAITGGDVVLENVALGPMQPFLEELRRAGVTAQGICTSPEQPGLLRIAAPRSLKALAIEARPHPGFPTDLQQPLTALLATAGGVSTITDHVFEARTGHHAALRRMGARLHQEGSTTVIQGGTRFSGAEVEASDLRAGAALVTAALAAEGETVIRGIHHITRGYEHLVEKLTTLGAEVNG